MLLLLLCLAGCRPQADSEPAHSDDSDVEQPHSGDSDTPAAHNCVDYFGVRDADTIYRYAYQTDFGLAGTVTRALASVAGSEVAVHEVHSSTWDDGSTELVDVVLSYRCDDAGVSLVSRVGTTELDSGGTPSSHSITYEPPALLIPAGLAPGTQWTTLYKGTRVVDGHTTNINERYTWQAVEETSVTVPAGTFTVLFIDGQGNGEDLTGDLWLNANLGLIQSQYETLTAY